MKDVSMKPYFIDGECGRLFCIHYKNKVIDHLGLVVYFPPFAEEMNKTRRMVALQCHYFAAQGYDVLMLDPHGTGDSDGEFIEASMEVWCKDYLTIINSHVDDKPLIFWGIRMGALLAAKTAQLISTRPIKYIFWQAVVSGNNAMTQFLRLRIAAEMGKGGNTTTKQLREIADKDGYVEVAGYALSSSLIKEFDNLNLVSILESHGFSLEISWYEIVGSQAVGLNGMSQSAVEKLRSNGLKINTIVLPGQAFWNSQEILVNEVLIAATVKSLPSS